MANVVTTAANLDDSLIELMDQEVIISGKDVSTIDPFVETKVDIGAEAIKFTIYSKLAVATTALTDGEDIDSVGMVDASVLLTPAEHGNVVTTTKLVNYQTGGKADRAAAELTGINMGESLNKLGVTVLESGTNATAAATAGEVAVEDLRGAYERLRTKKIPKINGVYVAYMHPAQISDLKDDYIEISKHTNQSLATNGVVGVLEGFVIVEDADVTPGKVSCFGKGALGKAVSHSPESTLTGPFDKLGRMMHLGWYGIIKYGKIDDNAIEIITGA